MLFRAEMAPEVQWRRVSDWKRTVLLVDLADVEPSFLDGKNADDSPHS